MGDGGWGAKGKGFCSNGKRVKKESRIIQKGGGQHD